jgi:hypothetical protein
MRRILVALTLAASAAACVSPEPRTGTRVTAAQASAITMVAAEQVQRCYRMPRVPAAARRIAIRLRVRFAPDGLLVEPPLLVRLEGAALRNQIYAAAMAEAATAAVRRCSPLRLPTALYRGGWDDFYLDFTPRALV